MKTLTDTFTLAALMAAMLLTALLCIAYFSKPQQASGSTLAFAVPKVASSSLVTVGPQNVVTVVATSSNCVTRVIATQAQPIMLSLSQNIQPTQAVGNIQSGSSTVAYNNGDYGCGAITGYAAASTSITVTTLNQ